MRQAWMRLALAMGRPDIGALQDELSPEEFREWIAYSREFMFGDSLIDWHLSQLRCDYANLHRDPKKRPYPFIPEEFSAHADHESLRKRRQKADEALMQVNALVAQHRAAAAQKRAEQHASRSEPDNESGREHGQVPPGAEAG